MIFGVFSGWVGPSESSPLTKDTILFPAGRKIVRILWKNVCLPDFSMRLSHTCPVSDSMISTAVSKHTAEVL
jgi:hypothetical protein